MLFFLCFMLLPGSYLVSLNILDVSTLKLDMSIMMDWMSMLFFSVLCSMVSCVLKFSCIYMDKDNFKMRFTWLVLTFVLSMSCLIFFPHFFFLLIGWDGLGMTSFLLVMYYLSNSSWSAGMKTYLMKRIGDSFFIMGLVLFLKKGYWDMKCSYSKWLLSVIMVSGCFTKSAQFPFSSWLPAAMAAPTPVSALVHSSTLVTAGIYIMMRFCYMFPDWLFFMIGMSGMWTLYSASMAACSEYDSKKVVAYSTLSQLGLMSVAISLNLPNIAFFHLMTHAMFKALIFMCVGYLMKKSGHFQDLRSLKGLWLSNPLLSMTLIMSSLSLLGFPFLAGFFSKELMMEKKVSIMKYIFHYLLILSLPLTSYYSTRLLFNMLKGRKYKSLTCKVDDKVLFFSMLPLYVGSLMVGAFVYPKFYSVSSLLPCHLMKFIVFSLIMAGVMLSWFDVNIKNNSFIWFASTMSFLVPFNSSFWKNTLSKSGKKYFYLLDQGVLSGMMLSLDSAVNYKGGWLMSSLDYFSSPKVKFYMSNVIILSILMGILS